MKALKSIQMELNAPKNLYNSFSKFKYRSAEGILEAVKPLLKKYDATLFITDEIVEVGGRVYVKATCVFSVNDREVIVSAFAREQESKKGMDESQITGSASSYARKYALNGLFLIDDGNDPDGLDNREKDPPAKPSVEEIIKRVNAVRSRAGLTKIWNENKDLHQNSAFAEAVMEKGKQYPKK